MGLMYTTVIGFVVIVGLSAAFIMHYITLDMPSSDSVRIDPKPEVKL
ncbi:hypothetical protein [Sporosarcina sp. FA9]